MEKVSPYRAFVFNFVSEKLTKLKKRIGLMKYPSFKVVY